VPGNTAPDGPVGPPSSAVSCGAAREYLGALERGSPLPAGAVAVESALRKRALISGAVDAPELSAAGRQVLRELEIRAYRADPQPLDELGVRIGEAIRELGNMTVSAEYFLAELGSVPPTAAAPSLRAVAAGLASRDEPLDDLVESFTGAWGEMEVLGGSALDRLLAAELLAGAEVNQSVIYPSIISTADTLRVPGSTDPVTAATLLHLFPAPTTSPPVDTWQSLRATLQSEVGAALVAGWPDALDRVRALESGLSGSDRDRRAAAILLVALGRQAETTSLTLVARTAEALGSRFPLPLLAAAIVTAVAPMQPEEAVDWLDKSLERVRDKGLAPSDPERQVLALSLLLGLDWPKLIPGAAGDTKREQRIPIWVALHAWLYRTALSGK
jgi:hypothetical protein